MFAAGILTPVLYVSIPYGDASLSLNHRQHEVQECLGSALSSVGYSKFALYVQKPKANGT